MGSRFNKEKNIAGGLGAKPQPPMARGVWGPSPQPPTDFYSFHIKKNLFQHTFLSKKDIPIPAVNAVTIIASDNTKMFSQMFAIHVAWRTLLVWEFWGSNPGSAKSAQCCQQHTTAATFLRSCVAQALSREDGLRHSLHALA